MSKLRLEEYVDKFVSEIPVSRPIFQGTLSKGNISFDTRSTADINVDFYEDPIDKLIVENSSEHFRYDTYDPLMSKFARTGNFASVYSKIMNTVLKVYSHSCGLKNPKSSVMYKWLDESYSSAPRNNADLEPGFIALYRYICKNADVTSRRFEGQIDQKHAKNILAILSKMKEKHERQSKT